MSEVQRILTLFKEKRLTPILAAKLLDLSASKMSRVLSGEQTFPAAAMGKLIHEYSVHPDWLFGYEGTPDEVIYMQDLVPKDEILKLKEENQDLKLELGQVYKQLAELMKERLKEIE